MACLERVKWFSENKLILRTISGASRLGDFHGFCLRSQDAAGFGFCCWKGQSGLADFWSIGGMVSPATGHSGLNCQGGAPRTLVPLPKERQQAVVVSVWTLRAQLSQGGKKIKEAVHRQVCVYTAGRPLGCHPSFHHRPLSGPRLVTFLPVLRPDSSSINYR